MFNGEPEGANFVVPGPMRDMGPNREKGLSIERLHALVQQAEFEARVHGRLERDEDIARAHWDGVRAGHLDMMERVRQHVDGRLGRAVLLLEEVDRTLAEAGVRLGERRARNVTAGLARAMREMRCTSEWMEDEDARVRS